MTALVIIGWLIITAIAFKFVIGGIVMAFMMPHFTGRFSYEWVPVFIIGVLFMWWSSCTIPFKIQMLGQ